MAFADCSDSNDPRMTKAKSVESVVSDNCALSPISSFPNNCSHIEVLKLPFSATYDQMKTIFSKYGPLARVVMDYSCKESSLNCYLTFENEANSVEALIENERIVGSSEIIVRKYTESDTKKGNKRLRTDENAHCATAAQLSDEWGSENQSNNASDTWAQSNGYNNGGSRGKRGSRRGGSSSRGCFKCGKNGHMSRECSKSGNGGSATSGSRACFSCGEEGHMSRDCPKGGGRACFNCGQEGHISRECSKSRGRRGRGDRGRGRSNDRSASSSTKETESESAIW